ncbi:MAG: CHAT domain-containing protein [Candidatus Acidiferrum sp.]
MRQGLYSESLKILQPEIPLAFASTDIPVWWRLTAGADHSYKEEFNRAETELSEAESLASTNHRELLGEVALRQGTLADVRGDIQTASTLYRKSLELSRANRDPYLEVASFGSLGLVATQEEHFDESIDWNSQTLRVAQSVGDQRSVAKTQQNMGWSYFQIGDYDRALELLEQASQSAHSSGLITDQLICQTNVAAVRLYLHDLTEAERTSTVALDLAHKLDAKPLEVEILNILADVALERGNIKDAESNNREAINTSRAIQDRAGETSGMLIAARIDTTEKRYAEARESLVKVIQDSSSSAALRWEAEARLAKVYDEEHEPAKANQEYSRSIATIRAARRSIQEDELRLTFLSSAIDFYDDYVDFLMQHRRVEDALRIADLTRSQTLVEGLAASSKSPAASFARQFPRALAGKLHATLMVYWLGQNHSYLWVVTPAKLSYFPLPPKSQIEPVVKAYRQRILEGRNVLSTDNEAGQQLYSTLVAPAHALIGKNARVMLFPAESLYGLNFETLIVPGASPHFWIEDVTLSTGSALAMPPSALQQKHGKQKSLLLVGNPEPASPDFPRLAQAPAEMQKISNHFSQANRDVLEGTHATPASYLSSNPGQFSYLHFVTHGTASHTRPLESAVILSKEGDSYKLYARDIVQHPLNAELVTISACNGAGTRAYAGEGLVGLSWAFLRAGAHNVIGALWEVSDASSTPQLMDAMYAGIDKGQDPATALRNAKLAILHASSASVFKKPFYWAPFQLYTGS